MVLLSEEVCYGPKETNPVNPSLPVAVLHQAVKELSRNRGRKCGFSVDRCGTTTAVGVHRRGAAVAALQVRSGCAFHVGSLKGSIFQDMDGGAPSLFGPSFDGGGRDLLRSFVRRIDAGLITYMTAIKIRAMMIRKKFVPPVALGRLGRSVHSLSLQ